MCVESFLVVAVAPVAHEPVDSPAAPGLACPRGCAPLLRWSGRCRAVPGLLLEPAQRAIVSTAFSRRTGRAILPGHAPATPTLPVAHAPSNRRLTPPIVIQQCTVWHANVLSPLSALSCPQSASCAPDGRCPALIEHGKQVRVLRAAV